MEGRWEWGPERADIIAWRWDVKTSGGWRDERASEDNMDGAGQPWMDKECHAVPALG